MPTNPRSQPALEGAIITKLCAARCMELVLTNQAVIACSLHQSVFWTCGRFCPFAQRTWLTLETKGLSYVSHLRRIAIQEAAMPQNSMLA